MRTNIFDFKKQKKDKIVLEEEVTDGPFLIFLKKNKRLIILLLALLALITAVIAIYYAIINIKDTSKVVTNLPNVVVDFGKNGSSINSSELVPTTGGKANLEFYSRYGNIGLKEGVILKTKEKDTKRGHIIYFSDGSALLIRNNGTIIRISSLENNSYGINDDGILLRGANTKEIKITKEITLKDNTKVIYYSDNSCYIYNEEENVYIFVRNSDNVVIENDRFKIVTPSGVSKELNSSKTNNCNITNYEDSTIKIVCDNKTYVVRDSKDVNLTSMTFPNDNEATIIKEENLKDGSKIIYYTDGSAEIIKDGESIMVRQSKDIIYTADRVIEIIETIYANSTKTRFTADEKKVTYLDNGGALIENKDGTYSYVYENSDIKYKDNNIKDDVKLVKEISNRTTKDGTIIINLEDGNSIIIDKNGYRVVKTDSITYDRDGNIASSSDDKDDDEKTESVTKNHITIENRGEEDVKYHIAIEISDNYKKYAKVALSPKYLRYNIVAGTTYLENQTFKNVLPIGTILEGNVKIKNETYILYTDKIRQGEKVEVDLGIWIDYLDITNDYQDSVFVGTLVVYSETIN